ncbi:ATP cone domain-containing protein [Acidianus brierleyi]|uniref:ATP-binding protein n=1 Tax=Acidianus brierleyi TaxID=41673 RepID=A0A2U9ID43_9CREN|nr:ATP cone domain-containing protein [Acidianus brierleyi]AWR93884.1 ATP-binding protein [Acidianus brierleyi]
MVRIKKSDGTYEDFNENKLYNSIIASGASPEIAHDIVEEVKKKLKEGMSTDEIRRVVLTKLKDLDPNATEAWKFYDRVAKGRITFEDGKAIVVDKGHLYLGKKVKEVNGKGLSSSEEVKDIIEELKDDLDYGISRATINARLYALFMAVLKTTHMQKDEKEKSIQLINNFREELGWKPYELKYPLT